MKRPSQDTEWVQLSITTSEVNRVNRMKKLIGKQIYQWCAQNHQINISVRIKEQLIGKYHLVHLVLIVPFFCFYF